MNWRLKAAAMRLRRAPGGRIAHRLAQKYVTRTYRFNPERLKDSETHARHYGMLGKPGRILEFGCGSHIATPLLLSSMGAESILLYDIDRLATIDRINWTLSQLGNAYPDRKWPTISTYRDLTDKYRIEYVSPGDVRKTGLPNGSIDFMYSTVTLEHIPEDQIHQILAECHRVSHNDSLWSLIIDYADHYSYFDKSITPYNFYQFSESAWKKFNPPDHYQNRLRHCDFVNMFERLGTLLENRRTTGSDEIPIPLDNHFSRYSKSDLLTQRGTFLITQGLQTQSRPLRAKHR